MVDRLIHFLPVIGVLIFVLVIVVSVKRGAVSSGIGSVRRDTNPLLFRVVILFIAGCAIYLLGFYVLHVMTYRVG